MQAFIKASGGPIRPLSMGFGGVNSKSIVKCQNCPIIFVPWNFEWFQF